MTQTGTSPRAALRLTVVAWVLSAVVTGWTLLGPYVAFAYRNASARLVTDTVVLCVALLGSYLVYGRYVRAHRLQDLLLAQSLVVFALASGPVAMTLALPLDGPPGSTDVWLGVGLQLAASGLLLAAAVVGRRQVVPEVTYWAARWQTPAVPVLLLGVLLVGLALLGERAPVAVDTTYERDLVRPELLSAHPVLVLMQLVSAFCMLTASTIWAAQAGRVDDPLVRWLAPACVLGGFARLMYALAPSLYTDWFYVGDLLRLGLYLLLLVGLAKELAHYWTARTTSAVLADRRRLAGELHDGVVQELSYIRTEAHTFDADPDLRDRVIGASDRALDEARAAIHALTLLDDEPFAEVLRRTARELARRHGIEVVVEADEVVVDPAHVHTLLRIVREAVTNAARHGGAQRVDVGLVADGRSRVLTVRDDGSGFDLEQVGRDRTGYGLVSMEERARSLPGTLVVESTVGAGSEVRVTW